MNRLTHNLPGFLIILAFVVGCGGFPPDQTGDLCHVDTDCKGDRICGQNGHCDDPASGPTVHSVELETYEIGQDYVWFLANTTQAGQKKYDLVIKDASGIVIAESRDNVPANIYGDRSVLIGGLKPGTVYIAMVYITWWKGNVAKDVIIFTTMSTTPITQTDSPPMFVGDPTIKVVGTDITTIDVLFNYTFTKPGRLYIYSKRELSEQWIANYVGPRVSVGAIQLGMSRFETGSTWFLFQARDDLDQTNDSRILAVNYQ